LPSGILNWNKVSKTFKGILFNFRGKGAVGYNRVFKRLGAGGIGIPGNFNPWGELFFLTGVR